MDMVDARDSFNPLWPTSLPGLQLRRGTTVTLTRRVLHRQQVVSNG
jgi:hypothetical protein